MSHGGLLAPQDAGGVGERGLPVLAVLAPVAPHVDHEEVQVRAPADPAVHALALHRVGCERGEVEHRPLRPGREEPGTLDGVAGVLDHALVEPVVRHLVVVPLNILGHLGVEAPDVLVGQVVAVVAAELLERLGDLRLLLGDEVLPRAAAGEVDLGLEGVVRVDHVAAVHEEVRVEAAHHLVEAHTARLGVDPPALARGVAGPHERHVTPVRRRRPEATHDGGARRLHVAEIQESHPIEHVLAGREPIEDHLDGVPALRQGRGSEDAPGVLELVRRGVLDQEARRPVGRAPHDGAVRSHLAGLDAEGDAGSRRRLCGGTPRPDASAEHRATGGEGAAEEPAATERAGLRHGLTPPAPSRRALADPNHARRRRRVRVPAGCASRMLAERDVTNVTRR